MARPPATSRASLEQAGLRLFAERGFDRTTVDDIAREAGIARRTFFTYFASKNDVVWGDFEVGLEVMRSRLRVARRPLVEALTDAVLELNALPPGAEAEHRQRMELILHVPALQAHSTLRYAAWREVVREFAATRLPADEALLLGHLSLAAAVGAYELWLADPAADLPTLLVDALALLARPL